MRGGNKEKVLPWWIPWERYNGQIQKRKSNDHVKSKFNAYFCTKCNCVWEDPFDSSEIRLNGYKYEDFPSYGLPRGVCRTCEDEK